MLQIAKLLLYNQNNQILVLHRSQSHPRYAHQPDLPGGEIEDDETPEQAVSREITEEAGINLPATDIKLIAEKQVNPDKKFLLLSSHIESTPEVNISWEHEGYKWLTRQQLLDVQLPDNPDDYLEFVLDHLKANA